MGLTNSEFRRLEWDEYHDLLQHRRKEKESHWVHTRLIVATLWNTAFGSKGGVKPEDVIRLSFDEVADNAPAMTEEEITERMKGWETIFDRIKPKNYKITA